jgi:hypothetical protein
MRISGHRTHKVFQQYNIVEEDDLRAAVRLLEQATPVNGGNSEGTSTNGAPRQQGATTA